MPVIGLLPDFLFRQKIPSCQTFYGADVNHSERLADRHAFDVFGRFGGRIFPGRNSFHEPEIMASIEDQDSHAAKPDIIHAAGNCSVHKIAIDHASAPATAATLGSRGLWPRPLR